MNILLDTHIALWAIKDDSKLSKAARDFIIDPDNTIYYSPVSAWEVLLKHDSPKNNLTLNPEEFVDYCEGSGYVALNMKPKHVVTASQLDTTNIDKIHSDPFDRLLLAQAKSENRAYSEKNQRTAHRKADLPDCL